MERRTEAGSRKSGAGPDALERAFSGRRQTMTVNE
jgi:hypothetical protein